ncbi:MAG TPA: benzoyl-CoA reductase subunit C [Candidatus Saccharimonadales bacterium]|nr:benzoyl-CoA reductase subunit C [Candidatus Saccharimonadales bacterium]
MEEILARAEEAAYDVELATVRRWKEAVPGRKAIGYMPIWIPREIVHAAGMLPVAVLGGGDRLEIIRGDAYFQSYICHIPRSTTELGVSGRLDPLDGMIFPSICDVIRNLSGMWQILFPGRYVHYFDFPQSSDPGIAARHCRRELQAIREGLERLSGAKITDAALESALSDYNENSRLIRDLYELRSSRPWLAPASEAYLVLRAGSVLDVTSHSRLLREYMEALDGLDRHPMDNIRVVLTGSFCEQPPLALLRTLERAGCDLVDDDLLLGNRFISGEVESGGGDPLEALARGFVEQGAQTASRYTPEGEKGAWLVEKVRALRADGVIFCAASFCDPALLEEPMLKAALDRAGIPHTSFKFSEDTGQFQAVREQTGTFADSIRLWSEA